MHHPTDRITHTTTFVTPVVEHWLEREIAELVQHEGSIRHHEEESSICKTSVSVDTSVFPCFATQFAATAFVVHYFINEIMVLSKLSMAHLIAIFIPISINDKSPNFERFADTGFFPQCILVWSPRCPYFLVNHFLLLFTQDDSCLVIPLYYVT